MTELDGSGHWMHTNVYANGRLLATYGANETFFSLQDWQGTKRVQTTSNGEVDLTYASLPYGDNLTVSGSGPNATDQFFTGKERDQESGNDYFGARYYSSLTGRFLSPDWSAKVEPVPYARLSDPQSMNLYAYVENSPMDREDADGHVQNSGTENNWFNLAKYLSDSPNDWGGLIAWQIASVGSNPLDGLSNISIATQIALIQTLTQISSAFAQPAQAQQQNNPTASVNGQSVTYTYPDGSKVTLSGTHPWRDNNPGDLKGGHGPIGMDTGGGHDIVIYPSASAGWEALGQTLKDMYMNLSIVDAMKEYAPGSDGNNPSAYAAKLSGAIGVSASTRLSALTPAQLTTFEVNIGIQEGYFASGNTMSYTAP